MTCKHGIEHPAPQEIRRLGEQERKVRAFLPTKRDRILQLNILRRLWDKAHPCYTCYTEP